jgi:hypothetical protein
MLTLQKRPTRRPRRRSRKKRKRELDGEPITDRKIQKQRVKCPMGFAPGTSDPTDPSRRKLNIENRSKVRFKSSQASSCKPTIPALTGDDEDRSARDCFRERRDKLDWVPNYYRNTINQGDRMIIA